MSGKLADAFSLAQRLHTAHSELYLALEDYLNCEETENLEVQEEVAQRLLLAMHRSKKIIDELEQ